MLPPNLLDLFEFKSRSILLESHFPSGWYLIQILFSISSVATFDYLSQNGIKLETKDMIQTGIFRGYLTQEQAMFLIDNKYAELYPIKREKTKMIMSSEYLIYACDGYIPPTNYSQITQNLFVVSDLSSIQNDDRVYKISPHFRPQLDNRYIAGFSQTGNQFLSYESQGYIIPRPLHALNLTGQGQVVAVADSGLNHYHCMFYDPNTPVPMWIKNESHRKIVLYDPIADDLEPERGHGSHVCGIIAGEALCNNCGLSLYNGMAPKAKLYMHDLGNLKSGAGDIQDINLSLFLQRIRYAGSFISSNSWGYPTGGEELRAAYSEAAYKNPDILFIFACGNSHNYFTIHSPSNSKNVLAVGALVSPYGAYAENAIDAEIEQNQKKYIITHLFGPTISSSLKLNPSITFLDKEILYIKTDQIFESANQKLVILSSYKDLCANLQTSLQNASIVVLQKPYTGDKCQTTIPVYILNHSLKTYSGKVNVYPHIYEKHSEIYRLSLSSQGPSDLGYSKPDIVEPGYQVHSALAGKPTIKVPGECSTDVITIKSGTSMAAPVAAGVIAIIRQFFSDGWYPTLTPMQSNSILPTSSLLKAVAINSAKEVASMVSTGFGYMVPYQGLGFSNLGIRIVDNHTIGNHTHHIYQIKVQKDGYDLSVTMSYLDPPLPAISYLPLFADLDLIVEAPNGKTYLGNNMEDQFSTTEKVIISKANKGIYRIHIISSVFSMPSNITYSIATTGKFDQNDFKENPHFLEEEISTKCIQSCSNGICDNGVCVCNNGYYGYRCNKKTEKLDLYKNYVQLDHKIVQNYQFKVINDTFTLYFNVDKPVKALIYCFNFKGSSHKISHPAQLCYRQNKEKSNITIKVSDHPSLSIGSYVIMSIYQATNSKKYVNVTTSGIEVHFSFINWMLHLPLKMLIFVSALIGIIITLLGLLILLVIYLKLDKNHSKHRRRPKVKIRDPAPQVPKHESSDSINIDINPEDNSQ